MKIQNSPAITPFGGLNYVLKEFEGLGLEYILKESLPSLPAQSLYSWKDIFYTYWSVLFCGGDCAEDVAINLNKGLKTPFMNTPSPDRLLNRLKELEEPKLTIQKNRSLVTNEISTNNRLSLLNIILLKKISLLKAKNHVLDYDNTVIFTDKSDAKMTYKKDKGYFPGVGIIGNSIVYIENRNGNCAPHSMQDDTIDRMMQLLKSQKIKVDCFRADSASYQFSTITTARKYFKKIFIRAKINASTNKAIASIENWKEIGSGQQQGSIKFIPFSDAARRASQEDLLEEYRLIVTRETRRDGQLNLFTGDCYEYKALITNDFEMHDDQAIEFYNQRGKQEREFDILKNDFAWNKIPFSKLEQNTVFLYITAMCRNIYQYIICRFSKMFKHLSSHFRLKKFIFRFICIPAKWVNSSRQLKLRMYGDIGFKT
jgi:hypothetical protein